MRRYASTLEPGQDRALVRLAGRIEAAEARVQELISQRDAEMRRLYANGVEVRDLVRASGVGASRTHAIVRGARPGEHTGEK